MTIANNQDAIAYGIKAGAAWSDADKKNDAGLANGTIAIYLAARTMTFSCTVERKGADKVKVTETNDFDVTDWYNGAHNANGSKDIKLMAARTVAVAVKLFNIDKDAVNQAVKTRLDRSLEMAYHLAKSNATMSDEAYKNAVVLKKSNGKECLAVPYSILNEAPKQDADEDVIDEYNANKGRTVPLNGLKGNSLATLGKIAKPPVAKRPPVTTAPSEGTSFIALVKEARAKVQHVLNAKPDDGADVVVTAASELGKELAALQQEIVKLINREKEADKADDISAKINAAAKPAAKNKAA